MERNYFEERGQMTVNALRKAMLERCPPEDRYKLKFLCSFGAMSVVM